MKSKPNKKSKTREIFGHSFSNKEINKSQQIARDVAEGVKNYDSVAELKTAIRYYNCLYCEESQKRALLETKMEVFRVGKSLMDQALDQE